MQNKWGEKTARPAGGQPRRRIAPASGPGESRRSSILSQAKACFRARFTQKKGSETLQGL